MAKSVKLKDRNNNQILPITRATTVEMNDGTNMQEKLDSIEDNILEVNYDSGNTALVFGKITQYQISIIDNDNMIIGVQINNSNPYDPISDFPMNINAGSYIQIRVVCADIARGYVKMNTEPISKPQNGSDMNFTIDNVTGNIIITIKSSSLSNPGG